jgi:hypothetical protein
MKIKPIQYKINDRFALSSDQWNWILIEGFNTNNPIRRYYANLKQLGNALLDTVAKDTLARKSITDSKNSPTGNRTDLLMDNITQDLELFLKGVTNEKAQ